MRTLLVCALALTAAPLAAQVTDTTRARPDSTMTPADSARRNGTVALDEVRVTGTRSRGYAPARSLAATKTDVPLRDTPQAATVVTSALIADQGMRSMADVVRYVPGVTMGQGEGHRDQPTIRGNSSTADFFVDGVRDDVQYLRDLYNVERVEALKGSNAMLFGRGGGGGVINRVTKAADRAEHREVRLETGAFGYRRSSLDAGSIAAARLAGRLNAVYENSDTFRDDVSFTRWGVNPTLAFFGARTTARVAYEHFEDERAVDRGIPSFRGAPSEVSVRSFFGNPRVNEAFAHVDGGRVVVEHLAGALTIRNQARYTWYDKFYQNVLPGAVDASGTRVTLSAYNNATQRTNAFNQTDLTWGAATGRAWHTLLAGVELGRQGTTNYRNTGYFPGHVTTTTTPLSQPAISDAVSFEHAATDADNEVTTSVAAGYVQDQVALSPRWQAVLGARWERFALNFDNHNTRGTLRRTDAMLSPRGGLLYKPAEPVSLYASTSVSHLPSSGDQFSSLNATTETLKPERFTNYELGAKWDATAELSLSAAVYRLDRTNSQAKDPNDPARTIQTGAQRTVGWELAVAGSPVARWQVAGGVASQRAWIARRTASAAAGATVPLVPARTLSLWNRVELLRGAAVGLGAVHQARSYAAIDNSVVLPAFTRLDGALFLSLPARLRAQLNVENLGNVRYFPTSQGNNNILPGSPRAWRLAISTAL